MVITWETLSGWCTAIRSEIMARGSSENAARSRPSASTNRLSASVLSRSSKGTGSEPPSRSCRRRGRGSAGEGWHILAEVAQPVAPGPLPCSRIKRRAFADLVVVHPPLSWSARSGLSTLGDGHCHGWTRFCFGQAGGGLLGAMRRACCGGHPVDARLRTMVATATATTRPAP